MLPRPPSRKRALGGLVAGRVSATELAGEPITEVLTAAPSGAPLGGVKVVTESGWFAARPSGTEDVYKLYAESFKGEQHLDRISARHSNSSTACWRVDESLPSPSVMLLAGGAEWAPTSTALPVLRRNASSEDSGRLDTC